MYFSFINYIIILSPIFRIFSYNLIVCKNISFISARTREHDDDDMKSKKRQRTTSPKPVQKVIVSSVPKTTTPKDSVSTANPVGRNTNVTLNEAAKLIKATSLSVKQENINNAMSSLLMKFSSTHSGSSSHSSKPIILGGSKHASSVSVATSSSKHIVPLPASCLQVNQQTSFMLKQRHSSNVHCASFLVKCNF